MIKTKTTGPIRFRLFKGITFKMHLRLQRRTLLDYSLLYTYKPVDGNSDESFQNLNDSLQLYEERNSKLVDFHDGSSNSTDVIQVYENFKAHPLTSLSRFCIR